MAYTERTSRSGLQNIGKSFVGLVVGILLVIGATVLLYWNEGRAVKTGEAIAEAQEACVPMADITRIDPAFSGKLVHATGFADTKEELTDPLFGIKTVAIGLQRKPEYFQWVEHSEQRTEKKFGGGDETVTTYTYKKAWVNAPQDSVNFKDPAYRGLNRVAAAVDPGKWVAKDVTFGAYKLPNFLIHSIGDPVVITPKFTDEEIKALEKRLSGPQASQQADQQATPEPESPVPALPVLVQNDLLYIGQSPLSPQIGDIRVTFTEIKPANISILAKVIGNTFEPFRASNGEAFSRLDMGTYSADSLFAKAVDENKTLTWILRGVGIFLVFIGFKLIMGPLTALANIIPAVGTLVDFGTALIAIVLALAWSLIAIAIAWFRFRPLLSGILLASAAALLIFVYRKRKAEATPVETTIGPEQNG